MLCFSSPGPGRAPFPARCLFLVRMSVIIPWSVRAAARPSPARATGGTPSATAAAILLAILSGCGNGPTMPSPQGPPTLTCPGDIDATAANGIATAVTFDLPPIQGGTPPLTLSCSPASGFVFPVGNSTVTCTVTDADQRAATCQFRVRVVSGLTLSRTRFLAFGDSITEGKIATSWDTLTLVGPGFSYPAQLLQVLTERYPAEEIEVINEGLGGETTNGGLRRLPGTLAEHSSAHVMLLLEGVNAINVIPRSTQLANLRSMVRLARDAGLDVLIATLTPVSDEESERAQRIRDLNEGIRAMAVQEGIGPAVDLYAAFDGQPSLLSADGLHPSEEGYRVIAETFADEITRRWEASGASTMTAAGGGAGWR